MCGVTCSSTPVSMYCDVVVTTLVVPPTMRLLVDRDLAAGLDRRLLVVERGEMRIGDHLGVAVGVEQVQHRLHAAGEIRVVDDVVEALRERQRRVRPRRSRRRQASGTAGLIGDERRPFTLPPEPRPDGAPPLNSQSTPNSRSSVSVDRGNRHLDHHLPRRDVELLQRRSMIAVLRRAWRRSAACCCPCRRRPGCCARCRCPRRRAPRRRRRLLAPRLRRRSC